MPLDETWQVLTPCSVTIDYLLFLWDGFIYAFAFPSAPGPPPPSSGNEQHSSASIFEHVDRLSRSSEASRRVPSKIQLIAMQPIPGPPVQHTVLADRVAETNKINKEVFAHIEKYIYIKNSVD